MEAGGGSRNFPVFRSVATQPPLSYTGVGVVQEHAANQILNDLVESCKLLRMEINLDYKVRGGLHTTVPVRYEKS